MKPIYVLLAFCLVLTACDSAALEEATGPDALTALGDQSSVKPVTLKSNDPAWEGKVRYRVNNKGQLIYTLTVIGPPDAEFRPHVGVSPDFFGSCSRKTISGKKWSQTTTIGGSHHESFQVRVHAGTFEECKAGKNVLLYSEEIILTP